MHRYHVLSKITKIENVGIVVADVSSGILVFCFDIYASQSIIGSSAVLIERISSACISSDIQPLVISVGKLTEAKLSNITGLDFCVLVSCPYVAAIKVTTALIVGSNNFSFALRWCLLLRPTNSRFFLTTGTPFRALRTDLLSHS